MSVNLFRNNVSTVQCAWELISEQVEKVGQEEVGWDRYSLESNLCR